MHWLFEVSGKNPSKHVEAHKLFIGFKKFSEVQLKQLFEPVHSIQVVGHAVHNPVPEESSLKNPVLHDEVQLVVAEIK